jgi:preprotein translocase subunit YajC
MNSSLAQPAAPAPSPTASALQGFVPMLLIVGIFYFVLLAPMRKQQKKAREMLSNLKKGDRVVTSGGLHGVIARLEDHLVWLTIADNVKVKLDRSAISRLESDTETKDAAA